MIIQKHSVLPENPNKDVAIHLVPRNFDQEFYNERVSRNIGWLDQMEQQLLLKNCTVGVIGAGGIGGETVARMVRAGVGTIYTTDLEDYDISNLNRQFGCNLKTLGKSKAFSVVNQVRDIADDTDIYVCGNGINERTADFLIQHCDIICDEVEFWAAGSRILTHDTARKHGKIVLNVPTVGHRVNSMKFTSNTPTIQEALQLEYGEAMRLQKKIQDKTAKKGEIQILMEKMLSFAAPVIPEYSADLSTFSTVAAVKEKLASKLQASIISTNVPLAAGFLCNQVLFHLLDMKSPYKRNFKLIPEAPEYMWFDAGLMECKIERHPCFNRLN